MASRFIWSSTGTGRFVLMSLQAPQLLDRLDRRRLGQVRSNMTLTVSPSARRTSATIVSSRPVPGRLILILIVREPLADVRRLLLDHCLWRTAGVSHLLRSGSVLTPDV